MFTARRRLAMAWPAGDGRSSGTHPLQFFGTAAGREDGTIASFSGLTPIGASTTLPFYLVPNKFSFGDDVIWTSGAHSVKFGATVTRTGRTRGRLLSWGVTGPFPT